MHQRSPELLARIEEAKRLRKTGMTYRAIARHLGVALRTVQEYLRKAAQQYKELHPCRVCGAPFWRFRNGYQIVCPRCVVQTMIRPGLARQESHGYGPSKSHPRPHDRRAPMTLPAAKPVAWRVMVEPHWSPSSAERERIRRGRSPWGICGEEPTAFRGLGQAGRITLDVERERGVRPIEAFVRHLAKVNEDQTAEAVRAIFAHTYLIVWACRCPESTLYVLEREAFPNRDGWYGACPRCGAVALRIRTATGEEGGR